MKQFVRSILLIAILVVFIQAETICIFCEKDNNGNGNGNGNGNKGVGLKDCNEDEETCAAQQFDSIEALEEFHEKRKNDPIP